MSIVRMDGKKCVLALLVSGFVFGIAPYANSAPPKKPDVATSCELPRSAFKTDQAHEAWNRLFSTPVDCKKWHDLTETTAVFEGVYHRKLGGAEVSDRFKKGLTDIDPHSGIITPRQTNEMQQSFRGSFGGIGIEVQLSRGDATDLPKGVLVVSPIDDTPGAKAGLKTGDVIVEIEEDVDGRKEMKSIAALTLEQAVDKLRGKATTSVSFMVFRPGAEKLLPFTIVRDVIKIQFVKKELKGDVGYIKLVSFSGETVSTLFSQAVAALERESNTKNQRPVSGYVLDLRNNPGGLLNQAMGILNLTLDRHRYTTRAASITISAEARGEHDIVHTANGATDILHGKPIIVLTNGGSASASEIVAGVLQLHGRALVASSSPRTFGKGTIQTIVPMESGETIRLTTGQYVLGSKGCERPVQGKGVAPDILLKPAAGERDMSSFLEEKLPDALSTSKVSDANCKYRFAVSAEHRAAAYRMLEVMGLQLAEPTVNPAIKKAQ